MNILDSYEIRDDKIVIKLKEEYMNLIKPFIINKDNKSYIYLGEYPEAITDKNIQNKLNSKAKNKLGDSNKKYTLPEYNINGIRFVKYPETIYNNTRYVCINKDNKNIWMEIKKVKWKIVDSSLELDSNLFTNINLFNENTLKIILNDMFAGLDNRNFITEVAKYNSYNLKELNLVDILNCNLLNFNSLTSEELVILSLYLGLFKGKKYKLEDIALLLNINEIEVLNKLKVSILKLETIFNKTLSDGNKEIDKTFNKIKKR